MTSHGHKLRNILALKLVKKQTIGEGVNNFLNCVTSFIRDPKTNLHKA